jgi:hypothetical protein
MLQIMFACVRTGQFVSTGIETDLDTFLALPEVLSQAQSGHPSCAQECLLLGEKRTFVGSVSLRPRRHRRRPRSLLPRGPKAINTDTLV